MWVDQQHRRWADVSGTERRQVRQDIQKQKQNADEFTGRRKVIQLHKIERGQMSGGERREKAQENGKEEPKQK